MFVQDQNQAWLNFYPVYLLLGCSLRTILFRIVQGYVTVQLSKFCLLFCDSVLLSYDSFYTLSHLFVSVKRFFNFFRNRFSEPVSSCGPSERGLSEVWKAFELCELFV